MQKQLTVVIPIEPDNPDGSKVLTIETTENPNFVSFEIGDHFYDVPIADLYRATMPFMDIRHDERN